MSTTTIAASALSMIAAIAPASTTVVIPAAIATVSAETVVTPKTAIATKAVIPPAIARRASWLVIARHGGWRVITRCRSVIARLGVVTRLRRHVDAPLLIIGGVITVIVRVSTPADDRRRLCVHIRFVVSRACVATSEEKGQQRDKQGSSIHGGLLDRDWAQTSDAGRRPPKRLADEKSDSEKTF
ncbi:hypothetical protein KPSA1_01598 [Pseudomonas syringae pv. actinidiae]|uniref:Secreted peptide n=1 Tax=Pseudomonas syringae pv. actinidiae TaxID=103796 RepID=A0A2V0Q7E2_PSESF|nr:hypothetical protein KPSA1_01598 [Pseudomonas syringae pv. actinidiae]GBH19628.1 hypothetical protein KPSA3_05639 [Pseudomonas syringae pv. actinidiae]